MRYVSNSSVLKRSLMRHMMMHTGKKPFKCDMCSYSAVTKEGSNTSYEDSHRREAI